jgi:hypothetical protein
MSLTLKRSLCTALVAMAVTVVAYVLLSDHGTVSALVNIGASIAIGASFGYGLSLLDLRPAAGDKPAFQGYCVDHTRASLARAAGRTSTGSFLRGKGIACGFWSLAHA